VNITALIINLNNIKQVQYFTTKQGTVVSCGFANPTANFSLQAQRSAQSSSSSVICRQLTIGDTAALSVNAP